VDGKRGDRSVHVDYPQIGPDDAFHPSTILLDLETTRDGKIFKVGAVSKGHSLLRTGSIGIRELEALDAFAKDARFILGHNILGHDFPILRAVSPHLEILNKPVIDTLFLSPLAFPQNPYHRLVKDYKLVRESLSDPISDAKLAASIYLEQLQSFKEKGASLPGLLNFYAFCFQGFRLNGFTAGLSAVFEMLGADGYSSISDACDFFIDSTVGLICKTEGEAILQDAISEQSRRAAISYCLAWLLVSGSNSVLPPWVRHQFPDVAFLLKKLRDLPCDSDDCRYCREAHGPEYNLNRFFGYANFREKPETADGKSLQRSAVIDSMKDKPVLAIMPTGGGKSLCFQLPAIVRHWRRGLLTVVFSPLQALMKDQVDNIVQKTGTPFAEAVYGLQTAPERGAALERIRLGDTAILYIAPEQLRSISVRNTLRQREIGCWVFDEAHCVSKWGHDFRPDYLYAARFIREFSEEQQISIAPVCCFTATAKEDVIQEIISHFKEELDLDLTVYQGGVERENLIFKVLSVSVSEKYERAFELIQEALSSSHAGSVIVYAATQQKTEDIASYLQHQGISAEAFHGGLDPKIKQEVLDDFVKGKIPVICATNAFGMGVDKDDIRLVLHFEMPGSMENYLQEAGRAGRDRKPAECILLYDPSDAKTQFGLGALSEIRQKEITRILRALRRCKRNSRGEIVVTSEELLRDDELVSVLGEANRHSDTKIRTAVGWLEKAGFLTREQNQIDVFQGKPLVRSMNEAKQIIEKLNLSSARKGIWLGLLQVLFNVSDDRKLNLERLGESLIEDRERLKKMEAALGLSAGQIIFHALHDMVEAKLIDKGILFSAIVRPKGKNNANTVLDRVNKVESHLLALMEAEDPDADDGSTVELNIRKIVQRLENEGIETTPLQIRKLIKSLAYDGKGLAGSHASIELLHVDRERYSMRLRRSWAALKKTAFLRRNIAHVILKAILDKADKGDEPAGERLEGSDVIISFSTNELGRAVRSDITLNSEVKKMLPAIDRALLFLHEQRVVALQGGLAAIRQAMTIKLRPEAKGRRYSKGDFKPLELHYKERRFQIHVMLEYVSLAMEKLSAALLLVLDYFTMLRGQFISKYFADRMDLIEKATSQELYRDIVESLNNPVQAAIVGAPSEDNMLILAGPGSGKTTAIVHRCAYLLHVERINPRHILVLCFNHNSAVSLRKRLAVLAGEEARGITVTTYHGAALRMTGKSVRELIEKKVENEIDFDRIIVDATKLLKGEIDIPGFESDEVRDGILSGYSHILVDEYQDIDSDQYDLVSAIAGRTLDEEDGKLTILAVGDDDQNIYAFRGANVEFIRRFKNDYAAKPVYLIENYRSSKHIIRAGNMLISTNRDRMKTDYEIQINSQRKFALPGGRWEQIDPVIKGRVQLLSTKDRFEQALGVKAEIDRLKELDNQFQWDDCAILARTRDTLHPIRSLLEFAQYPIRIHLAKSFPLHRVREVRAFIERLNSMEKMNCRASDLKSVLNEALGQCPENSWILFLKDFLVKYHEDTADSLLPVGSALDELYESVSEQKRDKALGRGIFLSTIHSAKGMEFKHVFVLDGDWPLNIEKKRLEEERRLLYVAMTRAKETLTIFKTQSRPNTMSAVLKAENIFHRNLSFPENAFKGFVPRRYEMLGLGDIYMDYAGCYPQSGDIHRRLAAMNSGDGVTLSFEKRFCNVCDSTNACVARLSGEAFKKLLGRGNGCHKAKVVAMIHRDCDDPSPEFMERIRAKWWEVPILEINIPIQQDELSGKA